MPRRVFFLLIGLTASIAGCRRPAEEAGKAEEPISRIEFGRQTPSTRLLRGVYPGNGEWAWTQRIFAVSLDRPDAEVATYLLLDFSVPRELMEEYASVTLIARAGGVEACRQTYNKQARHQLACHLPEAGLKQQPAEVEVELDRALRSWETGDEMGIIVVSAELVEFERTPEYREAQMQRAREAYEQILAEWRKLPREKVREMQTLFHTLPVWKSLSYQGVPIIKNPLDLWMMQQIIWEVRPKFIVETGTYRGGSALYWASVLQAVELWDSKVLTVDLMDANQAASAHPLWKQYVEFYQGSSTNRDLVEQIHKRVEGAPTLVVLDSDHAMGHVLEELKLYSPMVSPHSYIVVEDTHMDGIPTHEESGPGPMAAVRMFLEQGGAQEFEQDFSREALLMTFNPGGWLRRK